MKVSTALPWILIVIVVVGFAAYIGAQKAIPPSATVQTVTAVQPTSAIQKVDVMLEFIPTGINTPLYVGVDKGYFAKYGLQVNVIPNPGGSGAAIRALAAKQIDFSAADVGTLLTLMTKENVTNVRVVATYYFKNPMGIQYLIGKGHTSIKNPKDLEGKTVGSFTGNSNEVMFPLFCKVNGIDCSKVKIEHVSPATLYAALLSGKVDAVLLYSSNIPAPQVEAAKEGLKIGDFSFSDYGVNVYANMIMTRTDLIQSNPDLVKRFLQGYEEALQFAVAHPDEAVSSILKFNPQLNADVTRGQWGIAADKMGGKAILNAKDPLVNGWIDHKRMNETITVVSAAYGVPAPDPSVVYTDQFVKQP